MGTCSDDEVIRRYYEASFVQYLQDDFALATRQLAQIGPLGDNSLPHASLIERLVIATDTKSTVWLNLKGALERIWREPRLVKTDHVARVDFSMIYAVFMKVGPHRLAAQEREERDEAICWLKALTGAANDFYAQSQTTKTSLQQQKVLIADPDKVFIPSDSKNAKGWAAPPANGSIKPQVPSRNLSAVLNRSRETHAMAASSSRSAAGVDSDSDSLSDVPTDTRLSSPAGSLPLRRERSGSSDTLKKPSKKKARTSTSKKESAFKEEVNVTSTDEMRYLLSASTRTNSSSDRPRRDRRIPTKLVADPGSEQKDWFLPPSTGSTGTINDGSAASWPIGSSVWAVRLFPCHVSSPGPSLTPMDMKQYYPNYTWWPSIILDPSTAPPETQGKRVGSQSFLVKSIPTGADWRFVSSGSIRAIDRDQAEKVMSSLPPKDAPKVWKQYFADLVEGLIIALDETRLKAWASTKTETELWLEREKIRKKENRVWKPLEHAASHGNAQPAQASSAPEPGNGVQPEPARPQDDARVA